MNLDTVILQLKQYAPIFGGRVAGSADFAAGLETEAMLDLPAAYVVPMDESAGENDELNALQQTVTERIGIIVEFDNNADRRGQNASAQYDAVRRALWAALLNWNPDPAAAPRGMSYGGGQYLDMDRARLFYRWEFLLEIQITDADGFTPGDPGARGGDRPVPLLEIDGNSNPGDPPFPARVILPQPDPAVLPQ